MAEVVLRAPLKDLAGGNAKLDLDGCDGRRRAARLGGRVAEDGRVGPGRAGAGPPPRERVPERRAGTGGRGGGPERPPPRPARRSRGVEPMRELLVGTKKGLFVLRGDGGRPLRGRGAAFDGNVVEYAMRDPRSGRYFASVTSGFYGPRLMHADGPARRVGARRDRWRCPEGPAPRWSASGSCGSGEADDQLWAGDRPGGAVRVARRRPHMVAQPRAVGPAGP